MPFFAGKDADNQTILASAAPGAQAKPFHLQFQMQDQNERSFAKTGSGQILTHGNKRRVENKRAFVIRVCLPQALYPQGHWHRPHCSA